MHRIALEQLGRAENSWDDWQTRRTSKRTSRTKPASGRAALNPDKASQACPARIDLQPKGEHEGIVIGCFDGVVYSRGLGLSGTTDEEPIDGTFLPG